MVLHLFILSVILIYQISQELNKNYLNYIIEDDGPGIPDTEYENVFKPFYKIDKGRSDSKSSVGLGLSISSDIIRSHGGYISLDKSKMGGLRVKISLPIYFFFLFFFFLLLFLKFQLFFLIHQFLLYLQASS